MSRVPRGFRLGPVVLLALIAVLGVWARTATATPCKPDGKACRTNQSCCGTNGHNGLCVNSVPPGKRPAGACCTPTTCEAAGAQCGMIADGTCLTLAPLHCGDCPDDEICNAAHVCETTTTTTTSTSTSTTTLCRPSTFCSQGDCGPKPDGCGGTISCPCVACNFSCNSSAPAPNVVSCESPIQCSVSCASICDAICGSGGGGCASAVCGPCAPP